MKQLVRAVLVAFSITFLVACGSDSGHTNTSTILKINLSGTLAGNAISGANYTVTLPANVTPATTNGVVAASVVTASGTFAGSTIAPIVTYTPATAGTPGSLQIVEANSVPAGVTTVGEIATITLQLANGAAPVATDFVVSSVSVFDTLGALIAGFSASVAGVTLQ